MELARTSEKAKSRVKGLESRHWSSEGLQRIRSLDFEVLDLETGAWEDFGKSEVAKVPVPVAKMIYFGGNDLLK